MKFHKKNFLIFLAAAFCVVAVAGCSTKNSTVTSDNIIIEAVQTERQPIAKSTDDKAAKTQTVDIPVREKSEAVPKVVEVKNDIKKSTDDIPERNNDTEIDKSKTVTSRVSSDTDSETKVKSIDNEVDKSKAVTSKVSADTDSETKVKSTDNEVDKSKAVTSKVSADTDSETKVKSTDNEVDKSKAVTSKVSSDTDSETKVKSTDNEVDKSKAVTSKVSADTDSETKVKSIDNEVDKSKAVTSKVSADTDSETKVKNTEMETDKSKNTSSEKTKSSDSDKPKNETKLATKTPPKEYHIDVKHITQYKDMPTGCEIVSARMVLEYYGKNITYEHMLSRIPRANLKVTKDGKLYGKTPYQAFLGDPTKNSGFGCYPPVIMEMVANYNYNDLYAESTCNLPLDFIAKTYLPQDIPVLVWATIGMDDSYLTDSWYVEGADGKPSKQKYTWRAAEHCLVLVGYDEKYYYFSDPLSYQDVTYYEKSLVEKRYKEVGYNSMIIRKYE